MKKGNRYMSTLAGPEDHLKSHTNSMRLSAISFVGLHWKPCMNKSLDYGTAEIQEFLFTAVSLRGPMAFGYILPEFVVLES